MAVMLQKHLSFILIVLTFLVVILVLVSAFIQNSSAQTWEVEPKILIKRILNGKVTVLDLGLHFATTLQKGLDFKPKGKCCRRPRNRIT